MPPFPFVYPTRIPPGSLCQSILEKFSGNGECYIHQNGYYKSPEEELRPGETVDVAGRLLGGKGGFGSMLRAIGAQIEKTTNREACRDLTGRRLRAINDERRFRHYARIKAQREMEREEKRRRKLETLATSEPRHEFDDQEYISERMAIPERVEQALEDAFSEVMLRCLMLTCLCLYELVNTLFWLEKIFEYFEMLYSIP